MKRIASIQDISCLGRCSLTVALPVISAMAVECAIVPTAVLSMGLMTIGFLSFACGLILDTVSRGRSEMKRMRYLSTPSAPLSR